MPCILLVIPRLLCCVQSFATSLGVVVVNSGPYIPNPNAYSGEYYWAVTFLSQVSRDCDCMFAHLPLECLPLPHWPSPSLFPP